MDKPSLKLQELEPDPNDPWGDDKLGRKEIAQALTNTLQDEPGPLVVALNGGWGTGKTFLLKRWQLDLTNREKDRFEAIYFNAWEDDFLGDPLVAIIGQLESDLKESRYKKAKERIKSAAKPVFQSLLINGLKAGTGGIIALSAEDFAIPADLLQSSYESQQSARKHLKDQLKELAQSVKEKTDHPLIFIIDELDRCRPTFSIETLERIKHIFDVENMVFVLGTERQQMEKSIQAVYGNIDVGGYLRRFVDINFTLPESDTQAFCKHLVTLHGMDSFFENLSKSANQRYHIEDFQNFSCQFPEVCRTLSLSLRDIEHALRLFILATRNLSEGSPLYTEILQALVILQVFDPSLYVEFSKGACSTKKVCERLCPPSTNRAEVSFVFDSMEAALYLSSLDSDKDPILEQLKKQKNGEKLTRPDLLSSRITTKTTLQIEHFLLVYEAMKNNIYRGRTIVKHKMWRLLERLELPGPNTRCPQ